MSERKRKLRARYRAGALEALAQLRPGVAELGYGVQDPERVRELGRALHTLKGDAALVGLAELAAALHAAEDLAVQGSWYALDAALGEIVRDLERPEDGGDTIAPLILAAGAVGEAVAAVAATAVPLGPIAATGSAAIAAPAAAASSPAGAAAAAVPAARQGWVRLQTDVLDDLSDRLLELSTAYNRLTAGLAAALRATPTPVLRGLVEDADATQRQLDDVVGAAWALRLVGVEDGLRRLGEHAADLARGQGKRLRVIVDGGRAELERSMLDAIEQPLLHLIRNAVDHGVEAPAARGGKDPEARLTLEARTVGGTVEIAVEDDGAGIDPAAVCAAAVDRGLIRADEVAAMSEEAVFDLLFQFGFSTRARASALSGRGVGLDAVRGKVEGLGGSVRLSSRPGRGARFVIVVPAAIARERAVIVEAAGAVFAIPSRAVTALIRIGDHPRREVAGGWAIEHAGRWAPLRALDEVLGLAEADAARGAGLAAATPALVLDAHGRRHVLVVERIEGEHDLLRRPADALIGRGGGVTASSVLDDGRVALWPSVPALLRGIRARARRGAGPSTPVRLAPRRVLVVDDSPVVRDLVTSILRAANLLADAAADGEAAWRALADGPPDLIVSDIEMPRLDGFDLLRRVRERWPRLPVVMLTTRGSEEDRRRAVALGANAFLIKAEFEEGRLVDTVHRLIGEPS